MRGRPVIVAALIALAAGSASATAAVGVVATSGYGMDAVSTATAGDRTIAVWGGEARGAALRIAERAPGARTWRLGTLARSRNVWDARVVADAGGDAVVAWEDLTLDATGSTMTVLAVHRRAGGAWSAPETLAATHGSPPTVGTPTSSLDVGIAADGSAVAVVGGLDGSVTARRLPAGASSWDAPQVLMPAQTAPVATPDVALAVAGADAVALWGYQGPAARSIDTAELHQGAWSAPAPLPGGEGAFYPAVARTSDGRVTAAFTRDGGTWVTERPDGGAWTAPVRLGDGHGPTVASGPRTVAVAWNGTPGVSVRPAGTETWRPARPPLALTSPTAPPVAGVARDGSLVVGGTRGGQAAWTRLAAGGRSWTTPRLVSQPRDLIGARPLAVATPRRGPLGTLLWTGSVREGRLGMPRGGSALGYGDVGPGGGVEAGSAARIRIAADTRPRAVRAVVAITPSFARYAGPVRVRVEVDRGAGWRPAGVQVVDTDRAAYVRFTRPGRPLVRLAYGPGFRRVTNASRVRVVRPGRGRIVAGWYPRSIAAHGRDLWVLSTRRSGRVAELRLLDARTGRLRRGPVALPGPSSSSYLVDAGSRVLLSADGGQTFRSLDPAVRGLLGAPVTIAPGACAETCVPIALTVGGAEEHPPRSVGYRLGAVAGPDGRVWGFTPGPPSPEGDAPSIVVETPPGGVPTPRGSAGPMSAHGGLQGEAIAVPGGLWVRSAPGGVTWFGASGPGIDKGSVAALAGSGGCVWGLTDPYGKPSLVRLSEGAGADRPAVSLGGAYVGDGSVTIGSRTAWAIAPFEQTLVRVPLPAVC
ncbi:MAG: hypothetical protein AB7V42_04610 [Thermoleophilia bacterium]